MVWMRRMVAVMSVVATVSACAQNQKHVGAIILTGAGVAGIGIAGLMGLAAAIGPADGGHDDSEAIGATAAIAGIGGAVLIVAGIISFTHGQADEVSEGNAALAPERARAEQQMRAVEAELVRMNARELALFEQARAAARAGDCATALQRTREIIVSRDANDESRASVFGRDADIQRCLDPEQARAAEWRAYYSHHPSGLAFTRQGAAKAQAGDCAVVVRLELRLKELDPEFHDLVFVKDEAIKKCLQDSGPLQ